MAKISGAATRSSFGNVTATLGCELSSCTRASSTTKNISFTIRSYINTGSSWSYNSWWTWIDGNIYKNFTTSGSAHTNSNQNYYSDWVTLTKECTSTSYSFNIGVNGSWWNPTAYGAKDNVTFTISDVPAYNPVSTPTIGTPSISNITRTGAKASFSVSNNGGASIVDNFIDASLTNFGSVVSTISSTSGTFSGLTPNTTYYVRANASNGTYRGYSSVTSFKTTGNAPSVSSSTADITYNSAKVNYSATYDTNASYSSYTLVYGTSTSYGSTASSQVISGLNPNTTYYYKITVKDNQGRSGESTGSFKTAKPTAPTISSITAPTVNDTSIKIQVAATAGSGASSLQYRFSKDNGSTYTSWQTANNYTFTGLVDDTTYTFKAQVKDNYDSSVTSSSLSKTTTWVESAKMITPLGAKAVRMYIITSSGVKKVHKRNIKAI